MCILIGIIRNGIAGGVPVLVVSAVYWLNTAVSYVFYSARDWQILPCIRERFSSKVAAYIVHTIKLKKIKIMYIIERNGYVTGDCL